MAELLRISIARAGLLAAQLTVARARRTGAELPHSVRYADIEAVHHRAYRQYQVRPFSGPVVLFRAEQQPMECNDPTLGWSEWVTTVKVIPVPGSHNTIVEAPELADGLRREVEACRARVAA